MAVKILTSVCKLVLAGFHAIFTCRPVQTAFQVDMEIYKDKLSQSG